jgi:hypothetical protein
MTRPGFPFVALTAAACLLSMTASPPATAQSQNELRRENERLRAEMADLRVELEAARQEITDLKAEVDRLRALLDAAGQAPPAKASPMPEPQVTIDESSPDASPRALLKAIIEAYQEETADLNMGTGPDDPDRIGYLRRLNRWVAGVNREYRLPVEWHVRILEPAVRAGRNYRLRLQAVDPKTGVHLGDPFDAILSGSLASRLREHEERYGLDEQLLLKGVILPRVAVNEQRTEPGTFDNPRFVGPFVEFDFIVQAQTILPAPEETEKKEGGKPAETETPPAADR